MASFIDPRCAVPTFLLNNEGDAAYCGRIYGYITSVIITIFILAITFYLYVKYPHSWTRFLTYLLTSIIVIFLIWMTIPAVGAWINVVSWRGYSAQKDYYIKGGLNEKEALYQLQALEQTKIQADAIRDAANTMNRSITKSWNNFTLKNQDNK